MILKTGKKISFLFMQMRYWAKMFTGRSYYHVSPDVGKVFETDKLKGYVRDYTGKTIWEKEVDEDGIPVNTLSNGRKNQFPILIIQKALGHWDQWLISKDDREQSEFLKICAWLLKNQDENGGWDTWQAFGEERRYRYSALTQGQALSVLSRAWELTRDASFQQAAQKAFTLYMIPLKEEGISRFEENGVFFEEYPSGLRKTVLNGWIYALFGLYDYTLAFDDQKARDLFRISINTLARNFSVYDSGYWSYYDSRKYLSSPYYHTAHIALLSKVSMIDDNPVFQKYYGRWSAFQKNPLNRARAFIMKAFQKLKEPPRITMTE